VDIESGVGDPATGSDPQMALSWSNDGGHTWSSEYSKSMGKAGEYKKRAIWTRLGVSRDKVFRVMVSDPVKRILLGAYIE